jgi:Flp pilus assembly protein TadD
MWEGKRSEALTEAQQAVVLAPDSVQVNATLGDILAALGRSEEAHESYETALNLALTIEP